MKQAPPMRRKITLKYNIIDWLDSVNGHAIFCLIAWLGDFRLGFQYLVLAPLREI